MTTTNTNGSHATKTPGEKSAPVFGSTSGSSPKLIDVAEAAGVSLATASRALSAPEQVRAKTRDRVVQAANQLGYLAHGAARALASQRTRTIGAIFPPLENPVFATGTHALSQTLSAAGYTLLLATHDYNHEDELSVARRLLERGVDGLVLVGREHEPSLLPLLEKAGVPFELTWSIDQAEDYFSVGIDHSAAAQAMTAYLLGMGHRRFGVIAGQTDRNDRAAARLDGVRQLLASEGIELADDNIQQVSFTIAEGRLAAARLLESNARVTAMICGNDTLAIGAVFECHARGIRVPQDISVVGFDDIEMAGQISPGITTVHVPSDDIGALAGRRLLDRLAGTAVPRCEQLPFHLVERATAGPAPD